MVKFDKFNYVNKDNFGTFGDFHTDNYVRISHGIGDYRGAIQFNIDSITGNYCDLVEFFLDHCSTRGTPDKDFWSDPDLVKQAWADFYKFDVNSITAYDLTDKAEQFLAKFQECAEFYRDLYKAGV